MKTKLKLKQDLVIFLSDKNIINYQKRKGEFTNGTCNVKRRIKEKAKEQF